MEWGGGFSVMGKAPPTQLPCEAGFGAALPGTLVGNAHVHRQAGRLTHHWDTGGGGGAGCSLPSPAALRVRRLRLMSSCHLLHPRRS